MVKRKGMKDVSPEDYWSFVKKVIAFSESKDELHVPLARLFVSECFNERENKKNDAVYRFFREVKYLHSLHWNDFGNLTERQEKRPSLADLLVSVREGFMGDKPENPKILFNDCAYVFYKGYDGLGKLLVDAIKTCENPQYLRKSIINKLLSYSHNPS